MIKALILLSFLSLSSVSFSQNEKEEIIVFQTKLNREYSDSATSPLSKTERQHFKGHTFYPIDLKYRVTATFKRTPDEKPFKMASTRGAARDYVKYGILEFSLNGKKQNLVVYQSLDLLKVEAYRNYLFLPFKDLTNSVETYGGGRFIDLTIPEGNTIILDFNKAYNPFCAYSDMFACPITPAENTLNTEIKAGAKSPEAHH